MNHKSSLFDTHTHLQFKAFSPERSRRTSGVDEVIKKSQASGVKYLLVVGTDINSSKKAAEIATKHKNVYASVGIHPHHIFNYLNPSPVILSETKNLDPSALLQDDLEKIEQLLTHPKVIGVGETGIDRHIYGKTKYSSYLITNEFIELQKKAFEVQIKLAQKYQKSLIIHNREAVDDLLQVLALHLEGVSTNFKAVFHCAQPDQKLLDFAIEHNIYIGIDGDVTYDKTKQEFVKKIPLDLLVLETDSPFLTPEGLKNPNTPNNLNFVCEYISKILKIEKQKLAEITFKNSKKLFNLYTIFYIAAYTSLLTP